VRAALREALQFVADDFAAFPRLPIALGVLLAVAAHLLIDPIVAGPAFSVGLFGGLAWRSSGDDLPGL
jgi:hypothetical protein